MAKVVSPNRVSTLLKKEYIIATRDNGKTWFDVREVSCDRKTGEITMLLTEVERPDKGRIVSGEHGLAQYRFEILDCGVKEFHFRPGSYPNRQGQNVFMGHK